ncbi:hypothetical protein ACL1KF_000170 [Klebsiella aerogenes]
MTSKLTISRDRLAEIAQFGFSSAITPANDFEIKELARMALAAMDSEPVAYIFKHPSGKLFWALTDESNKGRRDVMPVYAAPLPAPVVSEDLYNLANHIASSKNGLPDEWQDWAEELESDIRRAAMFQAEPVTTANKLPETQFKQVADLYEMQFDDGRTCAFHTDAEKAVQWLNTCDGNKVQEYVKLERLQEAVSGNSPVIHKVDDNEAIS